jgi:methionine-rich copper-binding protein CopC
MRTKLSMFRRSIGAFFFTFLIAVSAALAHSHPVTMTPAKDSAVEALNEVSVNFSEDLEPKFSSLELQDSMGMVVSKTPSALDPKDAKHLTLALPALAPGIYTVHRISVAADGHRLEGKYNFIVK